jgi:hypothetical protein
MKSPTVLPDMTWQSAAGRPGWILLILFIIALPFTISAVSAATPLNVLVKDERTRETLDRAQVYVDGGYVGEIAVGDMTGALIVQNLSKGSHTLRVTRPGYTEWTTKFRYPDQQTIEVTLVKNPLVFLGSGTPSPKAFNVIFYPSSTSYSCPDMTKVSTPVYITNETKFREDVQTVIRHTYLELGNATSLADPLPQDYRDHFNFYYYYDPSAPADAFSGCSGTIPKQYWDQVTFSDVTVILYPSYQGRYSDTACQPTGCTQDTGSGHTVMKVPADQPALVKHETGHAAFGLIDTYCGDTYYYQNEPYPNVWESRESCRADAQQHNRDPGMCRQIQKSSASSRSCVRNYWQWDPAPDIMATGYSGTFGSAATQRINYVLSRVGV